MNNNVIYAYKKIDENKIVYVGQTVNLNNRDYRHKNIAYNLLVSAIDKLYSEGCKNLIIDWTNLMDLYRKFNFEIWKTYWYVQTKI